MHWLFNLDKCLIRVIKGSLVALKLVRVNGLYVLHSLTVDSRVAPSVVQCLDNVMLCHWRLWNISEKGKSTLDILGVFGSKPLGDLSVPLDVLRSLVVFTLLRNELGTTLQTLRSSQLFLAWWSYTRL